VRFLLDEGLPNRLADFLEGEGHDIATCGRDLPFSLLDSEILASAYNTQRILLANDKDFGDLVFRDRQPHRGVILFRLGRVPSSTRVAYLEQVLNEFAEQLDQFIVVSPRGIRIAPMSGVLNED
jgi:predicted nuclease of predicted toxin-antitoxin system